MPRLEPKRGRGCPCPPRRSSSARSSRTAWGWARGSSRSSSRGPTSSLPRWSGYVRPFRSCSSCSQGSRAGTSGGSSSASAFHTDTCCSPRATSSRMPTTRSTSTSWRRDRRAGRRPCSSRWPRLLLPRPPSPGPRVFYGHDRVPGPGEAVAGGSAKFQRLAERFPNHPTDFTLLYLGSTWLPRDLRALLLVARRRRVPVVVNQSGVAYPGWAGTSTKAINREFRRTLRAADHIVYQSEFCKRSADEFLGEPSGSWEVLYNAVDVDHFAPAASPPPNGPVLVLGGDQTQAYRFELA